MSNFCDFIQVYVFTTNHHLKNKLYNHPENHITLSNEPGRVTQSVGRLY